MRLASYAQQSQRYVKYDDIAYIHNYFTYKNSLKNIVAEAEQYYKKLIDEYKIAPEEARYILPECTATHLVVTMNLRELIHFLQLRMCYKAQDEIRFIANEMHNKVNYHVGCLHFLFKDIGPMCYTYGECRQIKPCKEQPWTKIHTKKN